MTQEAGKDLSQRFLCYSAENHAKGSGTATSYVTALNKLNAALQDSAFFLQPGESV